MKVEESWRFEIPSSSAGFSSQLFTSKFSSFFHLRFLALGRMPRQPPAHMKTTTNCKACARLFRVDHRNRHHHSYCSDAKCQRQRRAQAQKDCRTKSAAEGSRRVAGATSRLQAGVKPSEAVWHTESPMFIGLISMLTGSTDLEDIKAVCRRLNERGSNILGCGSWSDLESIVE